MTLPRLAFALLLLLPSPAAAGEDAPPAPPAAPPAAASRDEAPPVPAAAPAAPAAPAPSTSPEARELLALAAKAQGTADLVGRKAVTYLRAEFDPVTVRSEKVETYTTSSRETFALPPPGERESRLRSEFTVEGTAQILGHTGRRAWMWTKKDGPRIFQDREKEKSDFELVDQRRRLLRLALRVFFLGGMAEGPGVVTLAPDLEELTVPQGNGEPPRKVSCRRLDRAAVPADGEPALRLYLDAKGLRPVAALLLPADPADPSSLLTFAYDETSEESRRERAERFPAGVVVPDAVELFEVPAGGKPEIRITANVKSLAIRSGPVDDAEFQPPPKEPPK